MGLWLPARYDLRENPLPLTSVKVLTSKELSHAPQEAHLQILFIEDTIQQTHLEDNNHQKGDPSTGSLPKATGKHYKQKTVYKHLVQCEDTQGAGVGG